MELENPKPKTRYEIFQEHHFDDAVKCLTYQFLNYEPLSKVLNISEEEYLPFIRMTCKEAIEFGLSVVAVDSVTHQLQGLVVSKDLETPFSFQAEQVCPKLTPVFEMMGQTENRYRKIHPSRQGETVESFMVAIYKQYAGLGLYYGIAAHAIPVWLQKGYSRTVGFLTHKANQHMFLSYSGASVFETVPVKEFEYEGKKPFEKVTEIESCVFAHAGLNNVSRSNSLHNSV